MRSGGPQPERDDTAAIPESPCLSAGLPALPWPPEPRSPEPELSRGPRHSEQARLLPGNRGIPAPAALTPHTAAQPFLYFCVVGGTCSAASKKGRPLENSGTPPSDGDTEAQRRLQSHTAAKQWTGYSQAACTLRGAGR